MDFGESAAGSAILGEAGDVILWTTAMHSNPVSSFCKTP